LEEAAASVGLRINKDKTKKIKKLKTVSPQTDWQLVLLMKLKSSQFTYLRSVVSTTGGTDRDVEARPGKARSTFRAIQTVEVQYNWKDNKGKGKDPQPA